MENNIQKAQPPQDRLSLLMETSGIKGRFQEMLKDRAPGFMSSIISAVKANKLLMEADPMSVLSAAAIAASLDLPINPSLGYAYIIPYSGQAAFQMGYLGYVQLFLRSGQASRINALVIHEGDIESVDRLSGDIKLSKEEHLNAPVVGYLSFFRLTNGFERYMYMTKEQVIEHAKKYSQSYKYDLAGNKKSSKWSTDFDAMALKTVTKNNLKKYAPLSTEMRQAIQKDDSIEVDGETVYPDAPEEPVVAQSPAVPATSSRLAQAVTQVAANPAAAAIEVVAQPQRAEQQDSLPI